MVERVGRAKGKAKKGRKRARAENKRRVECVERDGIGYGRVENSQVENGQVENGQVWYGWIEYGRQRKNG